MSTTLSFPDLPRSDAREKVRGSLRYAADETRPGLAYAMTVPATIGRGRVLSIDVTAARAVRGVRLVLTHLDTGVLRPVGFLLGGGFAFQSLQPMTSDAIAYRGQTIALVVADTLEAAIDAAALVRAEYAIAPFAATIASPGAQTIAQADTPLPKPMFADRVVGDADAALATSEVRVEVEYLGPPQHQNPMEMLSAVAEWRDGTLTVHEGTQNAEGLRQGLARQFDIGPDRVRIVSQSAGGGFGQRNSQQSHTALVALAARLLDRPVKVVLPRSQIFHSASFRPASKHRIRLGAERSGRIVAAVHEADQQTSRHDLFPASYGDLTSRSYGIPNFRGTESLVRTDTQTPGYMRSPHEHVAAFAFECAMDEMAHALGQDPVALRLANDAQTDPVTGQPFSSRHLAACLRRGAERFGWSRRAMQPGSLTDADGTLVGWGVAAGSYKANTAPAVARLRVTAEGNVLVSVGVHEMGQGIRTAIASTVARFLDVPAARVASLVGSTGTTPQHLTAGSWGTATALPAVRQAALDAADALRALGRQGDGDVGAVLRATRRPFIEVEARHRAPGQPEGIFGRVDGGLVAAAGPAYPEFTSFSYVAHFVEVRVEPRTRRVRVPRVVSVVDCGRVVSPRTARSQVLGGVVWGIGAALREVSEVDPRFGGFLNADLAEYLVPVNADIGGIEVEFIDEPDPLLNAMGVKGVGEVAMTGVAPAIINAIHHATGRRVRHMPVRLEDVL